MKILVSNTQIQKILNEQLVDSKKDKITKIQEKLISLGYNLGPTGADGVWGKLTDKAWQQYISKKGNKQTSDSSKIVSKYQQTPNVLVSDSLVNKHIIFDPNTETKPFKCDEKGCAQWVSNQLDDLGVQRQGNAWHAHNIGQKNRKFTPFTNLSPTIQNEMAKLFSTINANPVEKSLENNVKSRN